MPLDYSKIEQNASFHLTKEMTEGIEACKQGIEYEKNPDEYNSKQWNDWAYGWAEEDEYDRRAWY